jgi:predicted PurR-regulated permease PerM
MKRINKKFKYIIILILSISLFFIVWYNLFSKTSEGFNVNDIDKMFGDIKDVTRTIKDIPNELNNIDKKFTQQVTKVGSQLEKKTEEMGKNIEKKIVTGITVKLKSLFTQLGEIFNNGLIKPILTLFNGIGNIFMQIFGILKQIGNKIASLPNCIITYIIKGSIDSVESIYNKIMPNFLKNIISFVYKYTLRYVFYIIGDITGYSDSVDKCYNFNVSTSVDKINSSLSDINSSFKQDFGKLNFSSIKF